MSMRSSNTNQFFGKKLPLIKVTKLDRQSSTKLFKSPTQKSSFSNYQKDINSRNHIMINDEDRNQEEEEVMESEFISDSSDEKKSEKSKKKFDAINETINDPNLRGKF